MADRRAETGRSRRGVITLVVTALAVLAAQAVTGGTALAASGGISTVAGGPGGPAVATSVNLASPCGLAAGTGGVYLADGFAVQKILTTGRLNTPAGTGVSGPAGDGGPATSASLSACGVAVDGSGDLVLADVSHNEIRVVAHRAGTFYGQAMNAGKIYAVAGDGAAGSSGDGGPATSAALGSPNDVAVDGAGNLVIADTSNNRVRVVAATTGTFYGQAMTAGDIYTVAGSGVRGFGGDGGPATAAKLRQPESVAVDPAGNLIVADPFSQRIRIVAASTGTFYGLAMTAGDIYTVAGKGTKGAAGDGGPATAAGLSQPFGVAVDGGGNLLIADTQNNRIRVVAGHTGTFYGQAMTAGDIYTVAGKGGQNFTGDGGPATVAALNGPTAVTVDGSGNLVLADAGNQRVRVVAGATGTFYGQAMTAGDIYTVAGTGAKTFSGDGGAATAAVLDRPEDVAVDAAGNTVIADTLNNRIRIEAATSDTFYGQAMKARDIYTVAGSGLQGFSGNGGPATAAKLNAPGSAAADRAGNLVIADTNNNRVRVIAAGTGTFYGQAMTAGDIYTIAGNGTSGFTGDGGPAVAAELSFPRAVSVDGAGNLLVADTSNNRVRVVAGGTGTFYGQAMTAGDIYTVAGNGTPGFAGDGGPATGAGLDQPADVTADAPGNLVIADTFSNRIRLVAGGTGTFYGQAMTAGDIYTVAGNGTPGFAGDGDPATGAELTLPAGTAVDGTGNLVVADTGDNRIRVVAGAAGTFYGQAMTKGDIYTVAGNGTAGYSGDGGAGTGAELNQPIGVAADGTADLLTADSLSQRIRLVAG